MGTWTAYLVSTPNGEIVRGVDRYDWHPNKPIDFAWQYGEEAEEIIPGFTWWWSASPFPGWAGGIIRMVWPACREFVDVGRYGETAVSNGFWPFLGGTEFDTVIEVSVALLYQHGWARYEFLALDDWAEEDWDNRG